MSSSGYSTWTSAGRLGEERVHPADAVDLRDPQGTEGILADELDERRRADAVEVDEHLGEAAHAEARAAVLAEHALALGEARAPPRAPASAGAPSSAGSGGPPRRRPSSGRGGRAADRPTAAHAAEARARDPRGARSRQASLGPSRSPRSVAERPARTARSPATREPRPERLDGERRERLGAAAAACAHVRAARTARRRRARCGARSRASRATRRRPRRRRRGDGRCSPARRGSRGRRLAPAATSRRPPRRRRATRRGRRPARARPAGSSIAPPQPRSVGYGAVLSGKRGLPVARVPPLVAAPGVVAGTRVPDRPGALVEDLRARGAHRVASTAATSGCSDARLDGRVVVEQEDVLGAAGERGLDARR